LYQERVTNEKEMKALKKIKMETQLELLNDQRRKENIIENRIPKSIKGFSTTNGGKRTSLRIPKSIKG